ncbi:hypothetical protein [Streptomyces vilmorinianum]|uniref:hypothetical protein n=1 Tax=Streptomyces vilmorinianum TaxID=3051092 RepID=UPI0010FB8B9A|nr:hypothetical protein [Streptomyces vilmorinianum]
MSEERLPEELRELGRHLKVPDVGGETMAERVLAQLLAEQVPTPVPRRRFASLRRRWKALLAALSGVLVVLVLTPPVRATVADWFGFGGVEVRYDPGARPRPGAAVPGCPDPVPLAEAAGRAGFEPLIPSALGTPDAVSVTGSAERGRAVISLCWRGDGGGGGGGDGDGRRAIRLDEFPARLDIGFAKQVRTHPEWVDLPDGEQGYWFATPHLLTFPMTDASGSVWTHAVRTAGPTLLWTRNGGALTLRLEGVADREEARRTAESAESAG